MAAEKMVSFQPISTFALCPHVHVENETGKDKSKEEVGCQDVALVVIVQASC